MMDYELTLIPKTGYLHAIVTGQNRVENVAGYLSELQDELSSSGCPYVLVEERLEGPRLGISDVFRIVAEGSERSHGLIRAMAYVDVNAEDDTMDFAELVATNRSMPVRVFSSVAAGEKWLQAEIERDQNQ